MERLGYTGQMPQQFCTNYSLLKTPVTVLFLKYNSDTIDWQDIGIKNAVALCLLLVDTITSLIFISVYDYILGNR